jgi:hypothetical protein
MLIFNPFQYHSPLLLVFQVISFFKVSPPKHPMGKMQGVLVLQQQVYNNDYAANG